MSVHPFFRPIERRRGLQVPNPGDRFGDLVVVADTERSRDGSRQVLCACDCGNKLAVLVKSLRSGNTQSCGCRRKHHLRERNKSQALHGEADKTPEWQSWRCMRRRCYEPNNRDFHNYGARGIRVCDRWRESFLNFLADMGRKPSPQHTLDRINGDRDYEPGNCQWATPLEQRHNLRPSLRVRA